MLPSPSLPPSNFPLMLSPFSPPGRAVRVCELRGGDSLSGRHGSDGGRALQSSLGTRTLRQTAAKQRRWVSLTREGHSKKKWSHFDLKSWVIGRSKIRTRILSTWKIFELIWLDIESQFDSILRVNLTRYWESTWLDIESQFDSIFRVNLTRYWESTRIYIDSTF